MTSPLILHGAQVVGAIAVALVSGGLIGAILNHWRSAPKAKAETETMDWARFQTEIARLDAKVTAQSARIDALEREVRDCHREKAQLEAEMVKLRAAVDARGEIRQRAQEVVSAERVLNPCPPAKPARSRRKA